MYNLLLLRKVLNVENVLGFFPWVDFYGCKNSYMLELLVVWINAIWELRMLNCVFSSAITKIEFLMNW